MTKWYDDRVVELTKWFADRETMGYAINLSNIIGDGFAVSVGVCEKLHDNVDAKARCLEAACMALDILARGRKTLIRAKPEVEIHRNFELDAVVALGFVRFTTMPEEGEWVDISPPPAVGLRYMMLPA